MRHHHQGAPNRQLHAPAVRPDSHGAAAATASAVGSSSVTTVQRNVAHRRLSACTLWNAEETWKLPRVCNCPLRHCFTLSGTSGTRIRTSTAVLPCRSRSMQPHGDGIRGISDLVCSCWILRIHFLFVPVPVGWSVGFLPV